MHGGGGARAGRSIIVGFLGIACVGASAACSLLVDVSDLADGPTGVEAGPNDVDAGSDVDGSSMPGDGGATYREVVMADDPLAYYRLDEKTAGIAKDETGRFEGVHEGELTLGVPPLVADGEAATSFGGAGRIEVASGLDFPGTSPFTVEMWLSQRVATADHRFPFFKEEGAGNTRHGYGIAVIDGQVLGERWGRGSVTSVSAEVAVGRTAHVVLTYDGQTLALWIDGAFVRSKPDTRSDTPVTAPALIGGAAGDGFDGTIDELAIYDEALSPERIKAHYAAGRRE